MDYNNLTDFKVVWYYPFEQIHVNYEKRKDREIPY
jgi:hypothetical protein